jgi:hypothetical protein
MITFLPILCEKMAFFFKTKVTIQFLHSLALSKRHFFGETVFRNHSIGPSITYIQSFPTVEMSQHTRKRQRTVFNFTPRNEIWPPGVKLAPRGEDPVFAPSLF